MTLSDQSCSSELGLTAHLSLGADYSWSSPVICPQSALSCRWQVPARSVSSSAPGAAIQASGCLWPATCRSAEQAGQGAALPCPALRFAGAEAAALPLRPRQRPECLLGPLGLPLSPCPLRFCTAFLVPPGGGSAAYLVCIINDFMTYHPELPQASPGLPRRVSAREVAPGLEVSLLPVSPQTPHIPKGLDIPPSFQPQEPLPGPAFADP